MGSLAAVAVVLLLLIALALFYAIRRFQRGKDTPAKSDSSLQNFDKPPAPPRKAAEPRKPAVFISYRREDSANARLIYERLSLRFGSANVFMDMDTLAPGDDFVRPSKRRSALAMPWLR